MTGSAFSLSALYSGSAFNVTQGEPVIGGLRGASRHYFCPNCMSWLFTRMEGMEHLVNVRSVMLDEVDPAPPYIETQTADKLPWVLTGAAHSFERFPPSEVFGGLIAEFARAGRDRTAS